MKKFFVLIFALALLITGCGGTTTDPSFAPIDVSTSATEATKEDIDSMVIDPKYDFDFDLMTVADFTECFSESYSSTTSSYKINAGDSYENDVTVITGENPGPSIYIIAGIHGDEEAAWRTGELLEKITINAGKLYILAPANKWGATSKPKKRTLAGEDPNRIFPGNSSGSDAKRYVSAIFNDVKDKKPDFVFDLHEAMVTETSDTHDFLGSTLVYTDATLFGDMITDIIEATERGEICGRPFTYNSPGPKGSINKTITEKLKIPTITVETFRGYQMEERVRDQLEVVHYVLKEYKMVE